MQEKRMREILFRAKGIEETDKDKWYLGSYLRWDKTTYCFSEDYDNDPQNTEHYIIFDVMTDWGLPNRHMRADINPDTLCQFTGLYDKNGVRIFEGDIVKHVSGSGVVRWAEGWWGFQIVTEYPAGATHGTISTNGLGQCFGVEVIGNVFDNPELLNRE